MIMCAQIIPHIDRDVYLGDYIETAIDIVQKHELTTLDLRIGREMKI